MRSYTTLLAMDMCMPPVDLNAYEVPVSLWSLVENTVSEHERDEIKNMLGESLVEQSIELHQEVETLLEIWRDYRDEATKDTQPLKRLPEPPGLRERLCQEISFFVERIKDKSKQTGRDAERLLREHNNSVLEYVMAVKRPGSSGYNSRPSTARSSRDGRETPLMTNGTPTSDRFSDTSYLSEEVDSMNDKLNVLRLDEVTAHLRETLEDEVSNLHGDIRFLQQCLEEEADFCNQSKLSLEQSQPTLTDLRQERSHLEKDLLGKDPMIPQVLREKRYNSNVSSHHSPAIKTLGQNLSPTPPKARAMTAVSAKSRPSPMKASHDIDTTQVLTVHQRCSPDMEAESTMKVSRSALRRARSNNHETRDMSEGPTHVTIRTETSPSAKLGQLPMSVGRQKDGRDQSSPYDPPAESSGRIRKSSPLRPSSASRFRQMVIGCRDREDVPPVGGVS